MPTDTYHIEIGEFAGPFDKLLELIEKKELDITRLSLSEVTGDFLEYLRSLDRSDPALMASFLVVAARLILIKSKALLPELRLTVEEEEEIGDLEARLRLYKHYKDASQHIATLVEGQGHFYRKKYLQGLSDGFYPADNISTDSLWSAVSTVFAILEEYVLEQQKMSLHIIRLEERIEQLLLEVRDKVKLLFRDISSTASKAETVVSFLAILHMMRHGHAHLEQNELYGDIEIHHK